ncbi:hypothetical protein TcasGA2_TC014906 [Tribolium castaneum]|uniref:Uncharacterized protein n=1 Tax=Tribolium castaneum TaxID=7070 RepID=D2A426_TRICA|nr:hypothetical protein TcasGA2_TC014906 [Tribolium castaneum]
MNDCVTFPLTVYHSPHDLPSPLCTKPPPDAKLKHKSLNNQTTLTSCDLNLESSNFFIAYFMSSYRRNSTTPEPSLNASAKHTSPASRMWSFKSCHEPDGGNPAKIQL